MPKTKGDPKPESRNRRVRLIGSESLLSVYANSVQTRVTPWDIRLEFGEIATVSNDEMAIQQRVAVTMSLPHAKAFLQVLARDVEAYEKQFGAVWQAPQDSPANPS